MKYIFAAAIILAFVGCNEEADAQCANGICAIPRVVHRHGITRHTVVHRRPVEVCETEACEVVAQPISQSYIVHQRQYWRPFRGRAVARGRIFNGRLFRGGCGIFGCR